jgi:hypothetical protein
MADVYVTGFHGIDQAWAFIAGMEAVCAPDIEIIEVGKTYVLYTDLQQDRDVEFQFDPDNGRLEGPV